MTICIAYIPVLHQGYISFLSKHRLDKLLLLKPEVIPDSITYLHKDLRAVSADHMQSAIESLHLVKLVEVATKETLQEAGESEAYFVLPSEDISEAVAEEYLDEAVNTGRVNYSPIFLRWDKKTATETKIPSFEQEVTVDEAAQKLFAAAYEAAGKSSDWWRHVGAVVTKDGKPLLTAFNQHKPSEQQHYFDGDARALFSAGEQIELTSAIHAEASLIGHAARAVFALEGCELYVTTFPCPPCAKLVAAAGIKKLYFAEGYALFDGEVILKAANIEVCKVNVPDETKALGDTRSTVIEYPMS